MANERAFVAKKSAARAALCDLHGKFQLRRYTNYQGTTLRRPFFFLLVDSFWLPESVAFCGVELCEPSAFVPAPVCVAVEPSPTGLASAVPVVVVVFTGFVFASAGAGGAAGVAAALGSPAVPGFAEFPSAGADVVGASSVAFPLAAPPPLDALPGVTISTTAALPPAGVEPPSCDLFPGVKISVAEVLSASGCKFGAPVRAAARSSVCGPDRTSDRGFLIRLSCSRGAFCSATIHACALGSG
jgi:hypothetical protein